MKHDRAPRWTAPILLGLGAALGSPGSGSAQGNPGVSPSVTPEDSSVVSGELGRRLDAYLSGAAGFGFDGVVVAEVGDEVVLRKGYGVADRKTGAPTTVDTLYALGSLSKSYTAALVLALAADGALPLEATLGALVDDVPTDKAAITVEQLMTHTAGLDYHPDAASAEAASTSREALLRALLAQPAIAAPGERFAYSNAGYTVLALLCERAGGAPFEQLLRERVFRPRGLAETTLQGEHELEGLPVARSWMDGSEQGTPREWPVTSEYLGAGGVLATASDVLAWMRSLEPEQVEPRVSVKGPVGYAAGFFTARTLRGTPVVYHAGDSMGFNVETRWYTDEGRRLVLLCNTRQSGIGLREPVLHRVALIAAGEEVPAPPRIVATDAEHCAGLAGTYLAEDGAELVVHAADGGIRLETSAAELARLFGSAPAPAAFAEDATRMLEAAQHGDFEPARGLMHAAVVRRETTTVLEDAWKLAEAAVGGITTVDAPIDFACGSDGCGSTWARVEGPSGTRFIQMQWMAGRLLGMGVDELGPALLLRAIGPEAFASYDLFRDARIDAAFGADGRLTLVSPLGSVELIRSVERTVVERAR